MDTNLKAVKAELDFREANRTASEELNNIVNRVRRTVERPNKDQDDMKRSFLPATHGCLSAQKSGVIAEKWDIQKLTTAMGAMKVAIRQRGIETVTPAEIAVYKELDTLHKSQADFIPKQNGLSFTELMEKHVNTSTPKDRVTINASLRR
jgi:hypothetical protein